MVDYIEKVCHKIVIEVIDNYRSGLNSGDNARSIRHIVTAILEEKRCICVDGIERTCQVHGGIW